VLTLDPKHRIVEGIATDGSTIWVSSILDRQILACRASCKTLATLPKGLHPFAIAWDAQKRRLWVAADCPPGVTGIKACDRGALIALSKAGRVVTRIAPPSGSFHPGDVSASPGGLFVSDSQNGAVYRLASSGYSLAPVIAPGVGKSGQGTALTADGKRLLVADYSQGVGLVDMISGKRTILPRSNGKQLRGSSPGALLAITPSATGLTFEQLAGLPDPTQLAYDGKRLLIVADSGWATLDKPGFVRTAGATVIALPLTEDCTPQ
jgi:sugar lactone lactonase YvrE